MAPGTVVDGRYQLVANLAHGGMGQVWRATDVRLGRDVALKLLDAERLEEQARLRFEREARTAAALSHPNIVAIHDVGVTESGVPYLVMELVAGETLADVIARGPLSIPDVLAVGAQVCDALQAAHTAGVVHRDVKPGNILLTGDGRAEVCDFGIASFAHDDDTFSEAGKAVGTAQFMAPEQAMGDAVDHRADLYALGCVIYTMVNGEPPFTGTTPANTAWQHIHQPVTPLGHRRPATPPALDELLNRLLAKDPGERPGSAAEVRAGLEAVAAPREESSAWRGRSKVATPPPTRPFTQATAFMPAPARSGRRWWWVAVLALSGTLLAIVFLNAPQRDQNGGVTAVAPSTPVAPPATSASAVATTAEPLAALTALEAAIRAHSGDMNGDALKDLTEKTREVRESLARGEPGGAADKLGDLRKRLDELRGEGKLGAAAYDALRPPLAQLAAALPPAQSDDD